MGRRRGQAYSQDLRDRVLMASGSASVVGLRFGVGRSYVAKARKRRDRDGQVSAGRQRSHTAAKLAGHADKSKATTLCSTMPSRRNQ